MWFDILGGIWEHIKDIKEKTSDTQTKAGVYLVVTY